MRLHLARLVRRVEPGGTANTKGSYVEFAASTTFPIRRIILGSTVLSTSITNATWLVDVAVGASGSEQVIVPDIPFAAGANQDQADPAVIAFDVNIPAGSRIALRSQCSITDVNDRRINFALHGVG